MARLPAISSSGAVGFIDWLDHHDTITGTNSSNFRYDAVNAMLLNEFLKEHRKMEQLTKDFESTIAEQQKQIDALTAGLQKVSAQLEANKPAPQVVLNDR